MISNRFMSVLVGKYGFHLSEIEMFVNGHE